MQSFGCLVKNSSRNVRRISGTGVPPMPGMGAKPVIHLNLAGIQAAPALFSPSAKHYSSMPVSPVRSNRRFSFASA